MRLATPSMPLDPVLLHNIPGVVVYLTALIACYTAVSIGITKGGKANATSA